MRLAWWLQTTTDPSYTKTKTLFFKDAGVEFEDIRYPYDDTWPAAKEKLKAQGLSATGLVPVLEYDGAILTQHIAILRFLARELGGYDGETSLEKHRVDTVSDIYNDWRTQWVANLSKVSDEFRNKTVPAYYDVLSGYYSKTDGPFLLGDRISYADIAVYQSIDNDEKIGTLPVSTYLKAALPSSRG
ncbi:hypothetical protein LTR84_008595 [Exophiala bonariae]|uniref:Glutathione S-transferase n=1 Tax=Exophiala bonariae TaxID=1690606 RepID=A0AAV9N002_9EURO|nr:hypothetical protein LTR84_008595 [Exophiala bonariae]